MQTIYDGKYVSGLGIRVSEPEYRKMEHGENCDGVAVVKKRENRCVKNVAPFL